MTRSSSKSINNSRVQVSKTGETRDLKIGMAIRYMIAKIQYAGFFPLQLRNIRAEAGNRNHQLQIYLINKEI